MANPDKTWKIRALAITIIEMNCKDDPLYETYKTEWEFKINKRKKIVEALRLFNMEQEMVRQIILPEEQQKSCYVHFINLGII